MLAFIHACQCVILEKFIEFTKGIPFVVLFVVVVVVVLCVCVFFETGFLCIALVVLELTL